MAPRAAAVQENADSRRTEDVLLAAAHRFLSGERLATELNVLSIVALTGLESGAKTAAELRVYIKHHTGVKPDVAVVDHAIGVLVGAGLAEQFSGDRWAATANGRQQVDESLQWAAASRIELQGDVARAAQDAELRNSKERAAQLTDVLMKVLEETLFTAIVYEGRGVEKVGDHLVPRSLDLLAMNARAVELLGADPEVHDLVSGLLRRALSPADGFASVQVTDLITAALMHLVVGHRDEVELRRAVGTLAGVLIVVDTPVALLLLAEPEVVANTERVLRQAIDCGVDVRFGPSLAAEITASVRYVGDSALRARVDDRLVLEDVDLVLDLVDGDGILTSYVRGRCDGRYETWQAFETAASNLTKRIRDLGARGIEFSPAHDAEVRDFLVAHNETIVRRGTKEPGTPGALADARLMAFLRRQRRRTHSGVWPAAWLLSPDTHVPETYRLVTRDREPATVTLGQLGALLLRFADTEQQVGLARAATGSLRRDALFATAARMPASVVDRLIEVVSNPGIERADRKKIRRGVAGVLERADRETNIDEAVAKVTNVVLAEAGSRVRQRYEAMVRAADIRADVASDSAKQARRDAETAEQGRVEAELRERQREREAAEAELIVERTFRESENRARKDAGLRRRNVVLTAASCIVLFIAYSTSNWRLIGIGGAAVWQAWVAWEEQIEAGRVRPKWSALLLLVVFAVAQVYAFFDT